MAIVDKTHSLTIEDLVSKIGTGGEGPTIKIAKFTSTYKDNVTTYSCDMSFAEMVEVFNNGGVVLGLNAEQYAIFEPVIMSGPDPYYFRFRYDFYNITGSSVNIRIDRINVYNNGRISSDSDYVTVTGTK